MSYIFEKFILNTNLLNFIFLVLILAFCAIKFNLKGLLISMQDKVAAVINDVNQNKADSEKSLAIAKESIKNLQSDIENINAEAEQRAKSITNKIVADANSYVKNLGINTDNIISAEEKFITNNLIKDISNLSIDKAKENIIKNLDNNIEMHEKYINESIDKLDGLVL